MSTDAVDHVFRTLAATYGADWDRSLGAAPLADVKTVWSDALDPYCQSTDGKRVIMWALKHLPDRAPNVRQFAALLRLAPASEKPVLAAPKADPERVQAELAKLGNVRGQTAARRDPAHMKDWARRIVARHEAGERVRPVSLRFAHEALRIDLPA